MSKHVAVDFPTLDKKGQNSSNYHGVTSGIGQQTVNRSRRGKAGFLLAVHDAFKQYVGSSNKTKSIYYLRIRDSGAFLLSDGPVKYKRKPNLTLESLPVSVSKCWVNLKDRWSRVKWTSRQIWLIRFLYIFFTRMIPKITVSFAEFVTLYKPTKLILQFESSLISFTERLIFLIYHDAWLIELISISLDRTHIKGEKKKLGPKHGKTCLNINDVVANGLSVEVAI